MDVLVRIPAKLNARKESERHSGMNPNTISHYARGLTNVTVMTRDSFGFSGSSFSSSFGNSDRVDCAGCEAVRAQTVPLAPEESETRVRIRPLGP
jgi:hypothetical protein